MKYSVFYLKPNVPFGMVAWDETNCRIQWFFKNAEDDLDSDNWQAAEALFFKTQEWFRGFLSPALCGLKPTEDAFWESVRLLLSDKCGMTEPKPLTELVQKPFARRDRISDDPYLNKRLRRGI